MEWLIWSLLEEMYFKYRRICYGITTGVIGSTFGTLATYVIYIRCRNVLTKGMTWELPIIPIVVAFTITVTVYLLSLVISLGGLFKSSIVESIRVIE